MRYAVQYNEEGIARCELQNSKQEAIEFIRYFTQFNIIEQYSTIDTLRLIIY